MYIRSGSSRSTFSLYVLLSVTTLLSQPPINLLGCRVFYIDYSQPSRLSYAKMSNDGPANSRSVRSSIFQTKTTKTRDEYVQMAKDIAKAIKADADSLAGHLKSDLFAADLGEKNCLLAEYSAVIARLHLAVARLTQAKDNYAAAVKEAPRASKEFDAVVNLGDDPNGDDADVAYLHILHKAEILRDCFGNLHHRLESTLSPPVQVRLASPAKKLPRRASTSPRRDTPGPSDRHRDHSARPRNFVSRFGPRRSPAKAVRGISMGDEEDDYPSVKMPLQPIHPDNKRYICVYCGSIGRHYDDYCPKRQTSKDRLTFLDAAHSCRLCLGAHLTDDHKNKYSECVHCGKADHHRSLCDSKLAVESRRIAFTHNY